MKKIFLMFILMPSFFQCSAMTHERLIELPAIDNKESISAPAENQPLQNNANQANNRRTCKALVKQHHKKLIGAAVAVITATLLVAGLTGHLQTSEDHIPPTPTPSPTPIGDCPGLLPAFDQNGNLIAKTNFGVTITACGHCVYGYSAVFCLNTTDHAYNDQVKNLTRNGMLNILENYCGPLNESGAFIPPQTICFIDYSPNNEFCLEPQYASPFHPVSKEKTCSYFFMGDPGGRCCQHPKWPSDSKQQNETYTVKKKLSNKQSRRHLERELYGKPLDFRNKTKWNNGKGKRGR